MRQRMLSALLAASMVLTMAPAAFAADVQDLKWDDSNAYKLTEDTTLGQNGAYTINADTNTVYTIDVDTYTLSVDTVTVNANSGLVIKSEVKDGTGAVAATESNETGSIAFKVDGSLVLGPNVKFESPVGIYKLTPDTAATVAVAPVSRAVTAKVTNGEVTLQGGNYDEGLTIHQNVAATVPAGATITGEVAVQNGATLTVAGTVEKVSAQAGAAVEINGTVTELVLPADGDVTVTMGENANVGSTTIGATDSALLTVESTGEGWVAIDGTYLGEDVYAVAKDTVFTITATPAAGYSVGNVTVTYSDDTAVAVTPGADNTYTCKVSDNATVAVNFMADSTGGGSTGGGGGSSASSYSVSVAPTENGTVTVSPKSASKGATVTITVTPDEGYELGELTVTDQNGNDIALTDAGEGKYTFTMPGSRVTVEATFVEFGTTLPFTDVASSAWYAEAVRYVYANGMMNGTSATQFSPNATTNRAMIVTILYRLEGSPAASASSFTDVVAGSYYADAVNWAAANGIVNGVTETSFAPTSAVTREQMAAILYRYAQFKGYDVTASNDLSSYVDASQISAYATTAMQWANAEGLITGSTSTTLNPVGNATRAEVATILMRFCENIAQ